MKASCSLIALLHGLDDLLGPEPSCDHRDKDGERLLPWPPFPTITLAAGRGQLTMTGIYHGVTMEIVVPARVREHGAIDLRASVFHHLLEGLLHGENENRIELSTKHGNTTRLCIAVGPTSSWISGTARANSEVEALDAMPHALPASEVCESIRRTLHAVGRDMKLNPAFRALHFFQTGRLLTTIGTDGRVLARSEVACLSNLETPFPRVGLSWESAELLARLLRHHTENLVDLRVCPTYCSWTLSSGSRLTSHLITQVPPDFLAVIPSRDDFHRILSEDFEQAFEMVADVGNPSILFRVQADGAEILLSGAHPTDAGVSTVIPIRSGKLPPWRGKFGTLYLLSIFQSSSAGEGSPMEISMGTALNDALVVRSDGYLAVLMPVSSTDADYRG